jgi:flagellar basal body-associated protein FliL
MDFTLLISIGGAFIIFLLGIIGWFLNRLVNQQDAAHKDNKVQFGSLLEKIDKLTNTVQDHKSDVLIIKEQITVHTDKLKEVNVIFERLRDINERLIEIETLTKMRAAH